MSRLADRRCIVTGGGRGIGRATAMRLTAAGANVIVAARTPRELEETVEQCAAHSGNCVAQATDLSRPAEIQRLIDRAKTEWGGLDVLINNAGVAPLAPLEETSDNDFEATLRINIAAVFYVCRQAWPLLKAGGGTIINISSMASSDPFPGFAAYGASKAWVNLFTRALAGEGSEAGIRTFAVAPGAVETQMLRSALPDLPADKAMDPDAVAGLIELLLDDRCRYASGQTIYCTK